MTDPQATCKHKNMTEWNNCKKPHQEPEGMAWKKSDPATKAGEVSPLLRAREIAEQIVRESRQDRFCLAVAWCDHLQTWIAAALEAERKAGVRLGIGMLEDFKADADRQKELVRQAALEEAAKMVHPKLCSCMGPNEKCETADRIRRLGEKR